MVASIKKKQLQRSKSDESKQTTDDTNNWGGFVKSILKSLLTVFIIGFVGANFIEACRQVNNPNFIVSNLKKPPYANSQAGGGNKSQIMKGGNKNMYNHQWGIYSSSENNFIDWYKVTWKFSDSSVSGLLQSILGTINSYALSGYDVSSRGWMNRAISWFFELIIIVVSIPLTLMLIFGSLMIGFVYTLWGGWNNTTNLCRSILGVIFMGYGGAMPISFFQGFWVTWLLWIKGIFRNPFILKDIFVKYKHTVSVVMLIVILSSATTYLVGGAQMGAIFGVILSAIKWYHSQYYTPPTQKALV